MVEHVQQPAGRGHRPVGAQVGAGAQAGQHKAHLADAVPGQHALGLALAQRQHHADQHRGQAEPHHDQAHVRHGHPGLQRFRRLIGCCRAAGEKHVQDAEYSVGAGLDHDPGQQRAGRRWSHRMGVGQPDVQRHHPGLDAEADQQQDERRPHQRRAVGGPRCRTHVDRTGQRMKQQDPGQQRNAAQQRHPEVFHAGPPRRFSAVVDHQQQRNNPQHFEADIQRDQVGGQHHAQVGRQQHQAGDLEAGPRCVLAQPGRGIQRGAEPHQRGGQRKHHADRIGRELDPAPAERQRADQARFGQHRRDQPGDAGQCKAGGQDHENVEAAPAASGLCEHAARGRSEQRPQHHQRQHRACLVGGHSHADAPSSASAAIRASSSGKPGEPAATPSAIVTRPAARTANNIQPRGPQRSP